MHHRLCSLWPTRSVRLARRSPCAGKTWTWSLVSPASRQTSISAASDDRPGQGRARVVELSTRLGDTLAQRSPDVFGEDKLAFPCRSGTPMEGKGWSRRSESNGRPAHYEIATTPSKISDLAPSDRQAAARSGTQRQLGRHQTGKRHPRGTGLPGAAAPDRDCPALALWPRCGIVGTSLVRERQPDRLVGVTRRRGLSNPSRRR